MAMHAPIAVGHGFIRSPSCPLPRVHEQSVPDVRHQKTQVSVEAPEVEFISYFDRVTSQREGVGAELLQA